VQDLEPDDALGDGAVAPAERRNRASRASIRRGPWRSVVRPVNCILPMPIRLNLLAEAQATEDRGKTGTFTGLAGHVDANGNIVHYGSDGTTEEAGAGAAVSQESELDQYYYQFLGSSFIGPAESTVEDGSFVRLRELSLSYSLPQNWLDNIHITALSITAFANNAFLWTKYDGVDPETSLIGPANGQGLDYFNNPGAKTYGIRLNVGLQ